MRLALNSRVGPYEVVALIGSGGMAEVYRARDTRLGRDVALKVMSEALGKGGSPAGWAAKDQLWVRTQDVPSRLLRYDIRRRRTLEERSVAPSELTGVSRIRSIQITPDGRNLAFDYERTLSYLYVLEGLSAGRW